MAPLNGFSGVFPLLAFADANSKDRRGKKRMNEHEFGPSDKYQHCIHCGKLWGIPPFHGNCVDRTTIVAPPNAEQGQPQEVGVNTARYNNPSISDFDELNKRVIELRKERDKTLEAPPTEINQ